MTKPTVRSARFWSALDEIPHATTDRREWRDRLGEEWQAAASYLRPTGELATRIDCPSPGGEGCPRRIVAAKSSVRAVCGQMPAECEALDLSQSDIEILALDRRRLAEAIAEQLGVSPQVRDSGAIIEVGSYGIADGPGIRVLLFIPGPMGLGREEVIERLRPDRLPSAVLTPTASSLPDEFISRLALLGHQVIALDGSMVLDASGRIRSIRSAESILTRDGRTGERRPRRPCARPSLGAAAGCQMGRPRLRVH